MSLFVARERLSKATERLTTHGMCVVCACLSICLFAATPAPANSIRGSSMCVGRGLARPLNIPLISFGMCVLRSAARSAHKHSQRPPYHTHIIICPMHATHASHVRVCARGYVCTSEVETPKMTSQCASVQPSLLGYLVCTGAELYMVCNTKPIDLHSV